MARDRYAQLQSSTVLSGLGQHLVTLSDAKKKALLSEGTQFTTSDEGRARADVILSRLTELNPVVARQFHPKQHALADLRLRMICATPPSSPESTIDNIATYIAVSYCWHYPQWPIAPAATPICDGWKISRPMVDAIMSLRQTPNEGIWLDQLCINQNDQSDTVAHIGVMDAIYRSARRVVILLEDVQLDENEEAAGLAYAGFYEDLCREVMDRNLEGKEKNRFVDEYFPSREDELRVSGKGQILAAAKPFTKKILGARWYGRAWCAHESRMRKLEKINNPLLLCFGSNGRVLRFEFRVIYYLAVYLRGSEPVDSLAGTELTEEMNDPAPQSLRQLSWRIHRLVPTPNIGVSALQHLIDILMFGCLKRRDLLSIALNTAGIPLTFDGQNIQCVEEVIWMFSLLVLASGDLLPFVTIGEKLRVPADGRNVVSWAIKPAQGVLDAPLPNPLPESITAITEEYIKLDLLIFESLPKQASMESQAKATRLIADHNLNAIGEELLPGLSEGAQSAIRLVASETTRLRPDTQLLHTFQHSLLSLALDNGLDWILNFPSAMLQATCSEGWLHDPVGSRTDPALSAAAHSLLSLFSNTSSTNDSHPTTTTSNTRADTTLLQKTTLALTTLLDPRLLLLTPSPRRLPLSPALGFAALTPCASNKAYIAVPTALAHLPGFYDRAWVIEPFDPVAAASRPEEVGDLLPPADLRAAREGEREEKIEDVVPVLDSDHEDRRAAMDEGVRGAWRMRRVQVLFGCVGEVWAGAEGGGVVKGGGDGGEGGDGVVLLKRQRVYGCEDYPWGEIHAALSRVFGDGKSAGEAAGFVS